MRNVMTRTCLACMAVVLCAAPTLCWGVSLTNGDFSSGLSGWDTPWGGVTWNAAGEYAEIHEQSPWPALEQMFDIAPGDTTLSFRYTMQLSGSRVAPGPYDSFTATLWDVVNPADPLTWSPIISNPNPAFTDFFYLENDGYTETAPEVSVAGGLVTADFSLGTSKTVLLSFELFGQDDGLTTLMTVDDVSVNTIVIPEPLTAVAIPMAVVGIASYIRRRRGRSLS